MAERIEPDEVLRRMHAGDGIVLVCAYADDAKCRAAGIEGALTFNEFRAQLPRLRNREIVFF